MSEAFGWKDYYNFMMDEGLDNVEDWEYNNIMNIKLPCPYCSSPQGFIYIQSHYQCLTCKRVVDDCCGGETMDCIVPIKNLKK